MLFRSEEIIIYRKEKIISKFDELLSEGKAIFKSCGWNGKEWRTHPSDVDYRRFKTEALNISNRSQE